MSKNDRHLVFFTPSFKSVRGFQSNTPTAFEISGDPLPAAGVTPPPGAPRSPPVREAAQDELARGIEPMPRQRINNLPPYALIGPHLAMVYFSFSISRTWVGVV